MITIRQERTADAAAREALLDAAYGPARFAKTSERLREGRLPAEGLSFVAIEGGRLVGTVRLWHVSCRAGTARRCCSGRWRCIRTCVAAASARADAPRAGGSRPARPPRRAAGRRCALLWPLRLLRRGDRRPVAARPLRARTGFWRANSQPGALAGACGLVSATGRPGAHSPTSPRLVAAARQRRTAAARGLTRHPPSLE